MARKLVDGIDSAPAFSPDGKKMALARGSISRDAVLTTGFR